MCVIRVLTSEINRAQYNQELMGGSQASRQCSAQTVTPTTQNSEEL